MHAVREVAGRERVANQPAPLGRPDGPGRVRRRTALVFLGLLVVAFALMSSTGRRGVGAEAPELSPVAVDRSCSAEISLELDEVEAFWAHVEASNRC